MPETTSGPRYDAGPLTEVSLNIALSPTDRLIVEYFPPAPDTAAVRLTFSSGRAYTFDARTGMLVREVWPTVALKIGQEAAVVIPPAGEKPK